MRKFAELQEGGAEVVRSAQQVISDRRVPKTNPPPFSILDQLWLVRGFGVFFAPPTALSTLPQKEFGFFLGHFGSSSWTLRRSDTYLKSSHLAAASFRRVLLSAHRSAAAFVGNSLRDRRGGRADMTYGAGRSCQTGLERLRGVDERLGGGRRSSVKTRTIDQGGTPVKRESRRLANIENRNSWIC